MSFASIVQTELKSHSAVADAWVEELSGPEGATRLKAFVIPTGKTLRASAERDDGAHRNAQLASWERVFDVAYDALNPAAGESNPFNVWISRFTKQPIPIQLMEEWVSVTTRAILESGPRSLLEVGCGTGLLLAPLCNRLERYVGTDIAAMALRYLEQRLRLEPPKASVTLVHSPAHDLSALKGETFDCAVMNSVVQYFPDESYLLAAVGNAVSTVRDGGTVFIGDVVSLPLLEVLHCAVAVSRADDDELVSSVFDKLATAVFEERELAVDPRFFCGLTARIPRVQLVEVILKRGRESTEMNQFRYDVRLHVGSAPPVVEAAWHKFDGVEHSLDGLGRLLRSSRQQSFGICGIPNARLAEAVHWRNALVGGGSIVGTIGAWKRELGTAAPSGLNPDDVYVVADQNGFLADITYDPQSGGAGFDVYFRKDDSRAVCALGRAAGLGSTEPLVNNPLLWKLSRDLVAQLTSHVRNKVPLTGSLQILLRDRR